MKKLPLYLLLTAGAVVMIYPLLWLVGASFKSKIGRASCRERV